MNRTVPMSALASSGSGKYLAPTRANFPSLRHRFATDCIYGQSLVDSIGGVTLHIGISTSGWEIPTVGCFTPPAASTITTTGAATWALPGGLASVWMLTGFFANTVASNLSIGDNHFITVQANAAALAQVDVNNNISFSASGVSNYTGCAIGIAAGGTAAERHVCNGSSVVKTVGTPVGNIAAFAPISSNASQVQLNSCHGSGQGNYYTGIEVFIFADGLPGDIAAALVWMAANPGQIYPPWAGRL